LTFSHDEKLITQEKSEINGASLREAAFLANIVVGKIGTASLTAEELLAALDE